jgi:hypothetical protein
LRTPSIQPKQSASSTDSGQLMLGKPDPTFRKPTINSRAVAWFVSSHARKWAALSKNWGSTVKEGWCGQSKDARAWRATR